MNNSGRKIPTNIENPFDIILISLCDKLINFCYTLKLTPNVITIFRMFSAIFILNSIFNTTEITFPVIGILMFYFLDCLDGHLARSTNQVTVLGDYLDHFADLSFIFIISIYLIIKKYPGKKIICITLLILGYLMLVHMGLQQKNYKQQKERETCKSFDNFETLNFLNNLHNLNADQICWTRFFGCGTFILFIIISIVWIQFNKNI